MQNAIVDWNAAIQDNCERIIARKTPIKIILKTRNDKWLLREWISHHSQTCGIDGIVIFDNGSDAPEVFDVYREFAPDLLIFRFSGHHNNLHFVELNRELYTAISSSCDYFAFLDTDEFACWVEADGTHTRLSPDRIADAFVVQGDFIPGIWFSNLNGDSQSYWIGADDSLLIDGIRWGKPLISAAAPIAGFINHNIQIKKNLLPANCCNLIVQHRNRLFSEQRIASNINKLNKRGFDLSANPTIDELDQIGATNSDPNVKLYIREILTLKNQGDAEITHHSGFMRFALNGQIEFAGQGEKDTYAQLFNRTKELIDRALADD